MLMRFFLSIWCWVILSELRQTEFCKNYIVFYLNCYLNCSCQRCDAIPVPQGEEGEAYCPGVSVVKGKVIDLDDDAILLKRPRFQKRRPFFTRYFLWFNFLNHLHSTLPEEKLFSRTVCRKWTHFMSNETVRHRKFNGRCSILLHSFWKLAGYYDKTFTFDDIVLATLARVKRILSLAELQMWLLHGQLP